MQSLTKDIECTNCHCEMKKILITGASGFIGSFLVEEALNSGYEVYAGIRKSSNIEYLSDPRIKFIELDFSDIDSMTRKISDFPYFDFVIHSAGLTKAKKKEDYFISNFHYSKNIIEVLIRLNRIPEKFVYMSSLAAYGPGDPSMLDSVKSSDTPRPVTSYGKSKLETEKYLSRLSGFPYIIIRPTAVYGPREKDLFKVFQLINKNIELILGFRKQHLTFVYVKDLVEAVFQTMESEIINRGYFISDGNVYDGKMFGKIIKKQLDKKTIRIQIPILLIRLVAGLMETTKYITRKQPVLNLEKVNELECVSWICDVKALQEDLNYIPRYDLNRGIQETTEWYKQAKWLK